MGLLLYDIITIAEASPPNVPTIQLNGKLRVVSYNHYRYYKYLEIYYTPRDDIIPATSPINIAAPKLFNKPTLAPIIGPPAIVDVSI